MPAVARHPRIHSPEPRPPLNVYRERKEADALGYAELCEQCTVWSRVKSACELALVGVCLGASVAALWLAKAWG